MHKSSGFRLLAISCLALLASAVPDPAQAGKSLWLPRPLAAGEIPLPERIVRADLVVLGRVTAIEDKEIECSPLPGSPHKVAYRIAVLQVTEIIHGKKGMTTLRLGFVSPKSYKLDTSGIPTPGIAAPQTMPFKVGEDGLFFVKKHHEQDFLVRFAFANGVVPSNSDDFAKTLDAARRLSTMLRYPNTALSTGPAGNRYLAATLLIHQYRLPGVKDSGLVEKTIAAKESKRLLNTLAEADWKYHADALSGVIYPPHPYRLFVQLGVTRADGYEPPKSPAMQEILDYTRDWLQANQRTYRVKRLLSSDTAKPPFPIAKKVYPAKLASGEPLTSENLRHLLNKSVTLEMTVQETHRYMLLVYLSAAKSKAKENVLLILGKDCVAGLKKMGIDSPATYFVGKTVRASGKLAMAAEQPAITLFTATELLEVKKK